MSSNGRHGKPDDEMFLTSPSDQDPSKDASVSPLRITKRDSSSPSPAPAASGAPYPDQSSTTTTTTTSTSNSSNNPPQQQSSGGSPNVEHPESLRPRGRNSSSSTPTQATLAERRGGTGPKPLPESTSTSPGVVDPPEKDGLFQRAPQRGGPAPIAGQQPQPQQEQEQQETEPRAPNRKASTGVNPYPAYHQQFWPPPPTANQPTSTATTGGAAASSGDHLQVQSDGVNRLSSTASNSTTKAQRGSPPPPETPISAPGQQAQQGPASDIEARYAASGIAGTSTLSNLHAQSAAAQQRMNQYAPPPQQQPQQRTNNFAQQQQPPPPPQQQQQQQAPARPWTPTEQPGTQPHGPPRVYQGVTEVGPAGPDQHPQYLDHQQQQQQQQMPAAGQVQQPPQAPHINNNDNNNNNNRLDQDFQRLDLTSSPPPAYSSVAGSGPHGYPAEKSGAAQPVSMGPIVSGAPPAAGAGAGVGAPAPPTTTPQPESLAHPAYANDPSRQQLASPPPGQQNGQGNQQPTQPGQAQPAAPASPPPLPEGWIAHLDPNSGQYYYIHLPTQSTQWEFPKGPTPLNLNEGPATPAHGNFGGQPLTSPGLSTFGKPMASPGISSFGQPVASPGLPMTPGMPVTPGYENFGAAATGPPPSSGVELYKVAPTNGVYFGPYLRYKNIDMERGLWLGSILLVTDAPQPPTIHIHKSVDLSPNPRQLTPASIAVHQRWTFHKYDIDLQMDDSGPDKWTYAITSHLGCTRYEFAVAGRQETNWRFIATSGNDFTLNVNANERSRLGGLAYMWKDIMQKHAECGGFHAHLGLGNQINADRLWKELPSLKQWLAMSGKEAKKNAPWTAALEEDVTHAYFHYYTSHFDQPHLREAFAQIPHVLQVDDHDIFDGFGSYPDYLQLSNMFKNIGRIGIEMYLLFQHHTTLELLRNANDDSDMFTITGTGWHFVKYLGPAIAVIGPDCRSERNPQQVLAGPTYQGVFPKVATLAPSVQHCIWMLSTPLIYPRLESAEHVAQTVATGKKAVTGAYNVLGKVTSSVAGVVGAKGAVGSGFDSVKRAVGKSGLMGSVLSPFGDIDILDELRDQWTHESKDLERTYLIRTLQGIAHQRNIRMSFFSGAVNCCGAGMVHDPSHPTDHKTMYQIISSAVVNNPPPTYVLRMLHSSNKPLYVPSNGQRSTPAVSDTKEDMLELFRSDVTGQPREHKRLMGRRNYVAVVAYDPDSVQASFGGMTSPGLPGVASGAGQHVGGNGQAPGGFPKVSLAVDFLVQGEGMQGGGVMKYGPVIVPSLELGR